MIALRVSSFGCLIAESIEALPRGLAQFLAWIPDTRAESFLNLLSQRPDGSPVLAAKTDSENARRIGHVGGKPRYHVIERL